MYNIKKVEKQILSRIDTADKKELILDIIAVQHLKNSNGFSLGANASIGVLSIIPAVIMDFSTIGEVVLWALGSFAGVSIAMNMLNSKKLDRLMNQLTLKLTQQYETPQMAYLEISSLIISVTREEILDHLKEIGCEYCE